MSAIKLIISGPMGAGKTTAIRTISDIDPISTEVANTDWATCAKEETTVALDYGEVRLENGELLHLYGTPGQERFAFMWAILASDALGVLLLIDHSRPDPLADLERYLSAYATMAAQGRVVIVVGRLGEREGIGFDHYLEWLAKHDYVLPILAGDVRRREDVLEALDTLLQCIELHAERRDTSPNRIRSAGAPERISEVPR